MHTHAAMADIRQQSLPAAAGDCVLAAMLQSAEINSDPIVCKDPLKISPCFFCISFSLAKFCPSAGYEETAQNRAGCFCQTLRITLHITRVLHRRYFVLGINAMIIPSDFYDAHLAGMHIVGIYDSS